MMRPRFAVSPPRSVGEAISTPPKPARAIRLLTPLLLLAGELASAQSLTTSGAWVRATPPGATTGAAYVVIANAGVADRLVGARSEVARDVQIHATKEEAGMVTMLHADALPVPSGGTLTLEPGGYHIMFIDLARALTPGDVVRVTLLFERAGAIGVDFPVRDPREGPR